MVKPVFEHGLYLRSDERVELLWSIDFDMSNPFTWDRYPKVSVLSLCHGKCCILAEK